jgi:NADH:ubiquinone oxidoreductase subunit E
MIIKPTIVICLGSSCFARGNNALIKKIQHYLEMKGLHDKVNFKGDHCFNNCSEGPNILIGQRMFSAIDENNIEEILDEGLNDLLN